MNAAPCMPKRCLALLGSGLVKLVFKGSKKRTVRFPEAPIAGQSIIVYSLKSQGASAYKELAKEVIETCLSGQQ